MNLQTHLSMQAGTQLSSNIDDERQYLRQKICEFLIQWYPQSRGVSRNNMNLIHFVERLENCLNKAARTKEEYLDLKTLGSRLDRTIRNLPLRNDNQQLQHANYSSSTGIMIPTPGYQQPENSSMIVISSLDGSLASNNSSSPTVYSESFLPTRNGSSENVHECSSDGVLEGGYQQSTSFSEGNNMITSMGGLEQMIPTPGYNNNDVNNNYNNQPFVNMESSDNVCAFPATESSIISQPHSRILHNLGGIRSSLPQNSYGLPNGSVNGVLGIMGNDMSLMNSHGITEGYLTGITYGNSLKPMLQHVDQNRHSVMQYGVVDAPGSGNLNVPVTSDVSMMNNQSLNIVSVESMATTNHSLVANQSTVQNSREMTAMKSQSSDQGGKMNFQLQYSVRENLVHPSYQFQGQKKKHNQNQLLLKNNAFSQCQLSSNIASVAKSVLGIENCCDMQSQFQQNSMEDNSIATQLLSHPPGPQDVGSSLYQSSDKMQQSLSMKSQQFDAKSENYFRGVSCGGSTQTNLAFHGQWYSKSEDISYVSRRHPHDHNVQNEFHLTLQQTAMRSNLSSEESMIVAPNASKSSYSPKTNSAACRSGNLDPKLWWKNCIRWLLLLRHACTCVSRQCAESNCVTVKNLWEHMTHCKESQCVYPRCHDSRGLLMHHKQCQNGSCVVCIPVKNFYAKVSARSRSNSVFPSSVNGSCKSNGSTGISGRPTQKMSPVTTRTQENLQPSKRMKIEQGSQAFVSGSERSVPLLCAVSEPSLLNAQNDGQPHESHIPNKSETTEPELELLGSVGQPSPTIPKLKEGNLHRTYIQTLEGDSNASTIPSGFGVQEVVMTEKQTTQFKPEVMSVHSESVSKSAKPKIKGVSLTELFTPEQVREHITGLRQWVGQSKAKVEKNQAMEHSMSENSCQLCAVERLTFEPPPLYCTPCGARVKRNAMYYTIADRLTRHYFCIPCYNEARGDTMPVEGTTISKAKMEKKKNDVETEEWWVQCDKCEAWQHQICTLFNGRRNDGGQAEYTCPNCYIAEVERGERVPLPGSTLLGAKDLPITILSDHIEQRLVAKLGQERLDRARAQGKHRDQVPAAEPLIVRVVSSVDKKLDVKTRFLEIFQDENYPVNYPYKSKVVLLFQNIEGVEVCLFGMYVQEFGSECQQPNQRRVYLSYLDSVKYFRPEVRAMTGEALRTFVYHEILIGYLEYCKLRGFTSCYIWACPPVKGEDYILYCHPEIQKTPKSDKLREWYLAMLRKATKENIVVELTNMYDHFFVSTGECRAKVTAARLPYFDGDYWPGAAEDMIFQLQKEEDGTKQYKKGTMKKPIPKRALKASGKTDLSGNPTKDLMLMHRLGETISRMKEDFIMVHLQHACTHCCTLMVSGNRWVCEQCKKFELCDRCYDAECKRDDRERHPIHHKNKHMLYPVEITGVPKDTKDKDEILKSEFFDTRQAFLNLCQGNHYQYDTLRRAKHSSMMVLYHLHNPTAPVFVTACNICALDIENGQGWRCEKCTEYHICNSCYQKNGGIIDHPHKLTNNPSSDHDAQNKEARQLRILQLKKMLELLVHASQCRVAHCQESNCRKVIELFLHGQICKTRTSGGCALCKKMWSLIQLHSRSCKLSECHIPRCRDLKDHFRRLQQQSEFRRRAAVTEMMRNRAAEVASGIS